MIAPPALPRPRSGSVQLAPRDCRSPRGSRVPSGRRSHATSSCSPPCRATPPPPPAYAYLSVAQYDAVVRAEDAIGGNESETGPTPGDGVGRGGGRPGASGRGGGG